MSTLPESLPLSVYKGGAPVETGDYFNSTIGENVKLGRGKLNSRAIVMTQNRYDLEPCSEVSDSTLELMEEVSRYLGV